VTVKEQRVYGSWYDLSYLRCILSGFERNRSVKIPSNQIMPRRFYTTSNNINPKTYSLIILPLFVTGFTDAEGCFTIIARKSPILWGWSPSGARPKGQSLSGTRSSTCSFFLPCFDQLLKSCKRKQKSKKRRREGYSGCEIKRFRRLS